MACVLFLISFGFFFLYYYYYSSIERYILDEELEWGTTDVFFSLLKIIIINIVIKHSNRSFVCSFQEKSLYALSQFNFQIKAKRYHFQLKLDGSDADFSRLKHVICICTSYSNNIKNKRQKKISKETKPFFAWVDGWKRHGVRFCVEQSSFVMIYTVRKSTIVRALKRKSLISLRFQNMKCILYPCKSTPSLSLYVTCDALSLFAFRFDVFFFLNLYVYK